MGWWDGWARTIPPPLEIIPPGGMFFFRFAAHNFSKFGMFRWDGGGMVTTKTVAERIVSLTGFPVQRLIFKEFSDRARKRGNV